MSTNASSSFHFVNGWLGRGSGPISLARLGPSHVNILFHCYTSHGIALFMILTTSLGPDRARTSNIVHELHFIDAAVLVDGGGGGSAARVAGLGPRRGLGCMFAGRVVFIRGRPSGADLLPPSSEKRRKSRQTGAHNPNERLHRRPDEHGRHRPRRVV